MSLLDNKYGKRRQFMVDPHLQKKVMANFFVLGITIIFINLAMSYFLVNRIIGHIENVSQASPELYEFVIKAAGDLMMYSLIANIAIIIGFCVYGLVFSNRIAGPIFNLNRAIHRILENEKEVQVQFRKDDYFHELSSNMNLLIKKLRP